MICFSCGDGRRTAVAGAGGVTGGVADLVLVLRPLGVQVALSLLGEHHRVLTFVCLRHDCCSESNEVFGMRLIRELGGLKRCLLGCKEEDEKDV